MRVMLWLITGLMLLTGCSSTNPYSDRLHLMAREASLHYKVHSGLEYDIATWRRIQNTGAPLHIYIEGSGHIWEAKGRLSQDPTPHHPKAFHLALADPHPNVVYLARPCQYVMDDPKHNRHCGPQLWSTHSLSDAVLADLNRAIHTLKREAQAKKIHLIGVGSGGNAAALLAGSRFDIASLRSVDGILDHDLYHTSLKQPRWAASLNAKNMAKLLRKIPQTHHITGLDSRLPREMAAQFLKPMGRESCAQVALHQWNDLDTFLIKWPKLMAEAPPCLKAPEQADQKP
ncbi:hypothetical protein [Magnetococcus sp. PR-3]|uniref:hypothetical protein n=1 Tax=Magnetococcus sp. PR-3 TaxID=3120355 RepID=UPI002FCE05B1